MNSKAAKMFRKSLRQQAREVLSNYPKLTPENESLVTSIAAERGMTPDKVMNLLIYMGAIGAQLNHLNTMFGVFMSSPSAHLPGAASVPEQTEEPHGKPDSDPASGLQGAAPGSSRIHDDPSVPGMQPAESVVDPVPDADQP